MLRLKDYVKEYNSTAVMDKNRPYNIYKQLKPI